MKISLYSATKEMRVFEAQYMNLRKQCMCMCVYVYVYKVLYVHMYICICVCLFVCIDLIMRVGRIFELSEKRLSMNG